MGTKSATPADKHRLYEMSVQDPSEEIRFIRRVYRKRFGSYPILLREDFCGTAAVCCRWAKISPRNRAVGIDLNPSIISWARRHNLSSIGTAAGRVRLVRGDVLRPPAFRPHVVVAMNFSYFTFKERSVLLSYFRGVRRALLPKGILVLDIYGGPESQVPQVEETAHEGFVYLWDQHSYNPVSGAYRCFIHFRLPDGRTLRRAFHYDWRLWSLPEVLDLLREAGFGNTEVYWEGTTKDGEGDGVFRPARHPVNDPAWIAYIVAG